MTLLTQLFDQFLNLRDPDVSWTNPSDGRIVEISVVAPTSSLPRYTRLDERPAPGKLSDRQVLIANRKRFQRLRVDPLTWGEWKELNWGSRLAV